MAGNEANTSWSDESTDGDASVLPSAESTVPEGMRLASPDVEKRSLLSRPIVAVPIFLLLIVIGGLMVSSLEKVPVPPTLPDAVEDEGPTEFERRAAATEALESLGLNATAAYASVRGVSIVDLATGQVTDVRTDTAPDPGPTVVIPANGGSYLVDLADPTRADFLATDAAVVATQTAGRLAVVGPLAGSEPEGALFASVVDRPAGEDLAEAQVVVSDEVGADAIYFPAPGFGAVVLQPDGSTAVYDLTGSRELSEHRVVAANREFRVEVRCSESCDTFLVGSDREIALPAAFDADVLVDPTGRLALSISPSGRWLLLYDSVGAVAGTSGARPEGVAAQLFEVNSGELLPVAAGQTGSPAWSDDGAAVAWLDPSGNDARLVVVQTDDRSVATIDLDALGAPNRDGDALVLISTP